MKRLDRFQESKMVDTVKTAVDRCGKGADPSKVVAELAIEKDMTTEQAARICEAVNKIASIEYLSNKDNDREADFPLADSAVVKKIMKDSFKLAKDPFRFRKTASEGVEGSPKKVSYVTDEQRKEYNKASHASELSEDYMKIQAAAQALKLASDEARLVEYKLHDNMISLANKCASLSEDDAQDMANYAVSHYGKDGVNFLTALENLTDREFDKSYRPFMKTGSDIEDAVDDFMLLADQVKSLRDIMAFGKEAAEKKSKPTGIHDPTGANFDEVDELFSAQALENADPAKNPIYRKLMANNFHVDRNWPEYKQFYNNYVQNMKDAILNSNASSPANPYLSLDEKTDMEQKTKDWETEKKYNQANEERATREMEKDLLSQMAGHRINNPETEKARRAFLDQEEERRRKIDDRVRQTAHSLMSDAAQRNAATSAWINDTISGAINNTKAMYSAALGALQKADQLRQQLTPTQRSGNEYSDPLSLKASKYLDNLGLHDTFAKAYLSDSYLRQYSPKEVAEAFNIIHEVAPDIITRNASPHVVSAMLRKYLANNNQIDPIEIRDLVSTEKDRVDTDLKRQQLENLKGNKPNK